ncbi:hypothetical protein [Nannocystis bainbridge]|uniref:Glycosyltransferase RgtA/B/C/D-like domain-containing protein n=1 Tax=Nannocystis bainbridge TaxID=2995303 RepID=A0ABT5DZ73_9BACT|nr:hypothetical protein [Nannocystis bainbridge]MDC0718460.1 hypothetical protein [Nannocystis bainbridge]
MLRRACRGGALVVLACGWAALRLQMNGEYKGATWAQIAEFTAPLPFGHRPLMSLAAWPLRAATDWPLALVWGALEAAAALGLWLALRAALRPLVGARWDMFFATCFFALLAFPLLLKHKWAVFYPWDTPAMAFTAAGLALVASRRFAAATGLCFVAALNRESAALIPAAALALHVGFSRHVLRDIRAVTGPVLAMTAAVVAARAAVMLALPDNLGAALHFAIGKNTPRWLHNLEWLAEPVHWLWLPMYFALLPVAWALLWRWISADHRRLALVALAWFLGLMLVANIYEPRVYGELLVLLYVPVAAAACRWLRADTLGAA